MEFCILGQPKSGKTSIIKVILAKMNPQQTQLLDPTTTMKVHQQKIGKYIKLNFFDFPGTFNIKEAEPQYIKKLENAKSIIYLIDVRQESFKEAIRYFITIYQHIIETNPNAQIHILLHKTDDEQYGVDDRKLELLRQIKIFISEEIDQMKKQTKQQIEYHMTTIYDHSLFEAFSKITQKALPHKPFLVRLLDKLVLNCKMEKVFLFDVLNKVSIATDSQPVDIENFSICSDMIDVFLDISFIYGNYQDMPHDNQSQSIIKLSNGTTLYLKEVEQYIVLICIIKEKHFDRPFLIDHNIDVFKEGLLKILKHGEEVMKKVV